MPKSRDAALQESLAGRINQIRAGESVKSFAARTGVNYRTMQDFIHGEAIPGGAILLKIVRNAGVSGHWLLTGEGPMMWNRHHGQESPSQAGEAFLRLPFLKRVHIAAGDVQAAAGRVHHHETVGFPPDLIPHPEMTRCVPVAGNSMIPEILDGWIVAIDMTRKDINKLNGRLVAVSLPDEHGVVVKHLALRAKTIALRSTNPRYGDIVFSRELLHPNMIVGRVVAIRNERRECWQP